jgi:hypothetical protein
MSNKAKILKDIVKGVPAKVTFGTDPKDPWSTKANIAEDAALNKFLMSRGINPEFVSKDTKVSHSKSGEFLKWKQDHMLESMHVLDKKDTITFDIPLLIRVLELTREHIKTDINLHKMVEKLINLRKRGVLTMDDYKYITQIRESFEIEEDCSCNIKTQKDWEKFAQMAAEKWRLKQLKKIDEVSTPREKFNAGLKKSGYDPHAGAKRLTDLLAKQKAEREAHEKKYAHLYANEDVYQDPKAATQTVFDGANNTDDTSMKSERSKSARIIKSIYKNKGVTENIDVVLDESITTKKIANGQHAVYWKDAPTQYEIYNADSGSSGHGGNMYGIHNKDTQKHQLVGSLQKAKKMLHLTMSQKEKTKVTEEIYDHEKEDKSVATYGKKPNVKVNDSKGQGDNPDKAAIIVKGGKTLTGQGRDTLEIDPEMKRPSKPGAPKDENK